MVKWPLLFAGKPWGPAEGTVECLLVAMSILALIALRYPRRLELRAVATRAPVRRPVGG